MCKKYCNVEAIHRFVPVRIDADEPYTASPLSSRCAPSEFVVRRYVMVVLIVPIAANTIAAQQKLPKVGIPSNAKGVTEWETKSGKVSANTFIYQQDGSYTKEAWIVVLVAIVVIMLLGYKAKEKMQLEAVTPEQGRQQNQQKQYNPEPDPRLWTPKLCEASAIELVVPKKVAQQDKTPNSFTPQQPLEGGLLVPKKVN